MFQECAIGLHTTDTVSMEAGVLVGARSLSSLSVYYSVKVISLC